MVKAGIVQILLTAFTVWPLVHHGLVLRYDINPWKLAGWAMYARPHIAPETHLFVVRDGRGQRLDEELWSREMVDLVNDYTQRRDSVGNLAGTPDAIGEVLLRSYPEEGVLVLVKRRRLDLQTGYIVIDLEQHLYRPDGSVKRGVRTATGSD